MAACRYIMEQANGTPSAQADTIATRIADTNPVLEAFGNAKTENNDNSSRFGKYLRVFMDTNNKIVSAKTDTYLLEKSRVITEHGKERNYHIFYMMLAGLDDGRLADLSLKRDYNLYDYLKTEWTTETDKGLFTKLEQAFAKVGIDQTEVLKVLAAIIHFGQVEISDKNDHAFIEPGNEHLLKAADLLGVRTTALIACICEIQPKGASKTVTTRPARKARSALNTLAKYL